jgi:hypothetical protein
VPVSYAELLNEAQDCKRGRGVRLGRNLARSGEAELCPEYLLCDEGSGKSLQQVLRLWRLEPLEANGGLGRSARQCLSAKPPLCASGLLPHRPLKSSAAEFLPSCGNAT